MAGKKNFALQSVEKQRYLDWLLTTPEQRDPRKLEDLAEELGVTRRTLTNWRTTDKEFMEAWEKGYLATIGNPERKQSIMDTLFETASDRDDPKHVQAAKTYMEIEGSMKPTKMQVEVRRDTSDLSDEQLEQLVAVKAAAEREARQAS